MTELSVRPMELADVDRRIEYFHAADDDYLALLGVDRDLIPTPKAWRRAYEADFARPAPEREHLGAMWLLDGDVVGWCNVDKIRRGEHAFMHLHMADPERRARGLGARFVSLSTAFFFAELDLLRIYCEPHAFNTAPHRTLQRAGFGFVSARVTRPGPMNTEQTTIRWVLDR